MENLAFVADRDQFLPFPPTRNAIFLSYCGLGEWADIHVKNRAFFQYRDGFSAYLLDGPDRNGLIPLRVDTAIVETALRAAEGDRTALTQLMRLSEMHFETSTFYPLLDEEGFTDVAMLPALVDRIRRYFAQKDSSVRDPHMYAKLYADPFVVA
jgi:hypothetical protein